MSKETRFQKQYLNSSVEVRDRFNVEFNKEEREMFTEAQKYIEQHKEATAIKQLAFLGWLAISSHTKFMSYLKHTLFKNKNNNERLGINVNVELENKFHQFLIKKGGKL